MRARSVLVALLAGLALVAAGCSGDETATTSTTAPSGSAGDAGSTVPTTPVAPPSSVDDAAFGELVDELDAAVAAADDDACALLMVMSRNTPIPSNAAQAEAAVDFIVDLVRRLAETPQVPEPTGETLRKLVDQLPGEAAAVGYDPEKIATLPSVTNPEFANALATIGQVADCGMGAG